MGFGDIYDDYVTNYFATINFCCVTLFYVLFAIRLFKRETPDNEASILLLIFPVLFPKNFRTS